MSNQPTEVTLDFFNKFSKVYIACSHIVNKRAVFKTLDCEVFIHITEDVYRELEMSKANKPYYIGELLEHAKYIAYFNDDADYVYKSEDYKRSF